jgi:hypothetical protein
MTDTSGSTAITGQVASPVIPIQKITRHTPVITVMSTLRPGSSESIVKRGLATMTTASGATGMHAESMKEENDGKAGNTGRDGAPVKAGTTTINRTLVRK